MNRGVLKILSRAYWNDVVDDNPRVNISLRRAIDLEYVKPIEVKKYTDSQIKQLKELGYEDHEIINVKIVYWITEKGLTVFKETNNYKRKDPRLLS